MRLTRTRTIARIVVIELTAQLAESWPFRAPSLGPLIAWGPGVELPIFSEAWDTSGLVSDGLQDAYRRAGAVLLRGYLDEDEVAVVRREVESLVVLQLQAAGMPVHSSERVLEDSAVRLADAARPRIGAIHDAAMKTIAVRRLATSPRLTTLTRALLASETIALNNNTLVRIDLPGEQRFLFDHWHQDYPYAMVSRHGVVVWTPLVEVSAQIGPVQLRLGSHVRGLLRTKVDPRGHFVVDDDAFIETCPVRDAALYPGDVLAFDVMTAHRSSPNRGSWPRWSLTYRYQDLCDPVSAGEGWPCYYRQGHHFTSVHADAVTDDRRGVD